MGFEERIDPELRDGLVLYEALGFEAEDLSGETLATMRTTSAALFAEAMADVPPNDRVVRQDRTVPGPDGEVRCGCIAPSTRPARCPPCCGSTAAG